jgi:hypothetical protein
MSEEVASQMLKALREAQEYGRRRVLLNEAAPDMLEALELAYEALKCHDWEWPHMKAIRAAISKAKGINPDE